MQAYYLEFILAGLAVLMLLAEAFIIPRGAKSVLALAGIASLAIVFILLNFFVSPVQAGLQVDTWVTRFYHHDTTALVFKNIALLSTIMVLLLTWDFRSVLNKFTSEKKDCDENTGEFYALPIFACAGMMWMASATDFVSIFVSLELVTICFYVMVAYMKRNVGSLEAGVKYLILGALSTGIFVYGIAWVYGSFGTTNIPEISRLVAGTELSLQALFGISLIIIAIAFKVGAVPMQLWIPDVYQGAPTPITAFLSVASKASGFAIAITMLEPFLSYEKVQNVLLVLAGATLLYGNLAALKQTNFKRLLAYSSIAHAGFILIALAYNKTDLVIFYLVTYMIMTFAAFFVLNSVRVNEDSDEISAFNGLGKRNPTIAAMFAVIMSAMAGLPLTIGFYGKFFVFQAMFESFPNILLAVIAFISVAAGFYYYLKVIKAMYWHNSEKTERVPVSIVARGVIFVLTVAILLYGFIPSQLIKVLDLNW